MGITLKNDLAVSTNFKYSYITCESTIPIHCAYSNTKGQTMAQSHSETVHRNEKHVICMQWINFINRVKVRQK